MLHHLQGLGGTAEMMATLGLSRGGTRRTRDTPCMRPHGSSHLPTVHLQPQLMSHLESNFKTKQRNTHKL